jgi:SAM-dependent methyltransferase
MTPSSTYAPSHAGLAELAVDTKKLAGFAAALAAADYPTAPQNVVMGLPSYREIGLEFLRYFIRFGELKPEDDVLDVGCGGGRMAAALGYYLASSSSYVGFDIHKGSIEWCREVLAKRWPNFRFDHFDIGNSHYNPQGALTGQSFAFPYGDASFSFVIATSVFTHLPRHEVKHYLHETARVLRPDGRFFATAYLMTPAAEAASRNHADVVKFNHEFGENPVQNVDRPLAAVAQRQGAFLSDVAEAGLTVDRIAYGWWSGLRTSNGKQDIIVLRKA